MGKAVLIVGLIVVVSMAAAGFGAARGDGSTSALSPGDDSWMAGLLTEPLRLSQFRVTQGTCRVSGGTITLSAGRQCRLTIVPGGWRLRKGILVAQSGVGRMGFTPARGDDLSTAHSTTARRLSLSIRREGGGVTLICTAGTDCVYRMDRR